jgi:hypothetical protein
MGLKCTKCGMPENTEYYKEIHQNRHHCRVHSHKDILLCNDCENSSLHAGCFHKFKYKVLCCWI